MKDYKTPEKIREANLAYYYKNKERLLEYQRKYREEQKARDEKVFETYEDMIADWNEYILKRLNSPKKLPKWIRRGMEIQYLLNLNKINMNKQE